MDIESRISHYALSAADGQRAWEFAQRMRVFCTSTLDAIDAMFQDNPDLKKVGVHHVYEKIKSEPWSIGITLAWALYSVADMIRLYGHCYAERRIVLNNEYKFVVSTKTLKIGKPTRLVIPRPSIILEGRSPILSGDCWTGTGRVSIYKKHVNLYLEVLSSEYLER